MEKTYDSKWRSIIGLILIYLAIWFEWNWAWGILVLLWVLPDLRSGVTYFMEPIEKLKNPFLFWTIIATWLLMGMISLTTLIFPDWKLY